MKDFIVNSLELISKVAFVLLVAAGFFAGAGTGRPGGAIVGLIGAFVVGVVFFGVLFVLLEMNENLRAIRKSLEQSGPAKQG